MIKINAGISRKLGLPQYSSAAATCAIEAEYDASLLHDSAELGHAIRQIYRACEAAVGQELDRLRRQERAGGGRSDRPATPAQLRTIHGLAHERSIDLGQLLAARFRVAHETDLSVVQASGLIDLLRHAQPTTPLTGGAAMEGRAAPGASRPGPVIGDVLLAGADAAG